MKIGQPALGGGAAHVEAEGNEGGMDALEKDWSIKQAGSVL